MTNNAKPNGFETDISKATQAFEEMLTPQRSKKQENTDVEEVSETEAETEIEAQEEIEDETEAEMKKKPKKKKNKNYKKIK